MMTLQDRPPAVDTRARREFAFGELRRMAVWAIAADAPPGGLPAALTVEAGRLLALGMNRHSAYRAVRRLDRGTPCQPVTPGTARRAARIFLDVGIDPADYRIRSCGPLRNP